GMVGCKIVLPDNRIMSAEFRLKPEATAGSREIDRGQRDYIRECDAIIGAAWLMKREVAQKVGFFDERFFPSQYEDIDYCLRIRLGDYKIIYDGEVKVIHGHLFRHLNRCAKNRRLFYKKWANTLSRYPFRDTHPFNKHMSRGICYFKKNLFGRAVSEFYKAEMTGAGFGEPFYMGTALYSVGEYQKALGEFKTLSSLFPNETRFHRYLAILYGKAGLDKGRDREVDYLFAWLSGGRKPKQGI
ncbi:MAG: glycosyltransferase family 2 protein, partial [Candidatus Omnitrophica bacterium]|nr:glycosyltransferase family 2 protein [Candidatus Omnitrophota bacterium]